MSPSPTKKSKANASNTKKRRNISGDSSRTDGANAAVARRVAGKNNLIRRENVDKVSTTSPSSDPSDVDAALLSMFGDDTKVYGGQFFVAETVNDNDKDKIDKIRRAAVALERLLHRVATTAFHNSAQRVNPPRCHPDTRKEILKSIYDWIIRSEDREKWLLWLNGAAGAGKSAIMQSLVEKCGLTEIAIASFFFSKGDHSRNIIAPLVATLAYQLIRAIPETKNEILLAIENDPLILDQSLESQFQQLIIQPLLLLPRELQRLFVVFIDGLDECGDRVQQSNLLKVLGNVSWRRLNIPIIFLIASRREYQIVAAFELDPVADLHTTVPLDNLDINTTSDDIRRFLIDKFKELKETHLNRRFLPPDWPPISAIDEIVAKSSGQFIFAAVVINHISSPRYNPARQLELVHDIRLREASSQNPFAHLDALYQHIFSQVVDLDKVLDILASQMLLDWSLSRLENAFQLESGEAAVCLADLAAVITCDYRGPSGIGKIKFLHASLPDFLQDKRRSGTYHIDLNECGMKLLYMFLESPPPILVSSSLSKQEDFRLYAIDELIKKLQPSMSDQLHRAFMNFHFMHYSGLFQFIKRNCMSILEYLYQQKFYDQGQAYCYVFDIFASVFEKAGIAFWDQRTEQAHLRYVELLRNKRASTVTLPQVDP